MTEHAIFLEKAVFLALLVEAVVRHVDALYEYDWNGRIKVGASIVLGILFCWATDVNAFNLLKMPEVSMAKHLIGIAGTGLVVARGAKVVHDLFSKLNLSAEFAKRNIQWLEKNGKVESTKNT